MPSFPDTLLQASSKCLHEKEDFSENAILKAKLCLVDFLTSVFSTHPFPWVQHARNHALRNSTSTRDALILGTDDRVTILDAAFVNAVAGHSLVRDDMHVGSVSHLGVVVIPTVLALAEKEQIGGHQLLEAIICGYEAGAWLGSSIMDVETARIFRPTGLCGAFASAAAAAHLLKLDTPSMTNALGFASNYFNGLNEWAAWGSNDMYFHPGIACRNGITAAWLAQEGADSAPCNLDGKAGVLQAFNKVSHPTGNLPFASGEAILEVFFKQVPACNYAQTAAQVAKTISENYAFASEEVSAITIDVPYAAAHYPGCNYSGPFNSILQARMSIQFNVASALLHKNFMDSNYHNYSDTVVAGLINKIQLNIDEALTNAYPNKQGARIIVSTEKSNYEAAQDDVIKADEAEVNIRFSQTAESILGSSKASRLVASIDRLTDTEDIRSFLDLLSPC